MSQLFSLDAQVCGLERSATAESDGYGITVHTSSGPVRARSTNDAIRIARDDIGEFLHRGERRGVPWGLRVSVGPVQAVYGEWPLLPGGGGGGRVEDSPVVRIRREWNERSGPSGALANAIRIIRAYLPAGRAGRAA
jgi:plasmid stabilization system protein ParE